MAELPLCAGLVLGRQDPVWLAAFFFFLHGKDPHRRSATLFGGPRRTRHQWQSCREECYLQGKKVPGACCIRVSRASRADHESRKLNA